MSDRRITFFELHTHGNVQFGPSSVPGIGGSEEPDAESTTEHDGDSEAESGGSTALRALLVLGVLVAVAAAVRKFKGGDDRPEVPLAESDEIAPTQD